VLTIGTLYLPVGYDKSARKMPMLIWATQQNTRQNSAGTSKQKIQNRAFTFPNYTAHLFTG
jgi:hypothetical protein